MKKDIQFIGFKAIFKNYEYCVLVRSQNKAWAARILKKFFPTIQIVRYISCGRPFKLEDIKDLEKIFLIHDFDKNYKFYNTGKLDYDCAIDLLRKKYPKFVSSVMFFGSYIDKLPNDFPFKNEPTKLYMQKEIEINNEFLEAINLRIKWLNSLKKLSEFVVCSNEIDKKSIPNDSDIALNISKGTGMAMYFKFDNDMGIIDAVQKHLSEIIKKEIIKGVNEFNSLPNL